MRAAEERIESLHARMESGRRANERRKTVTLGAASGGLTSFLLLLVFGMSGAQPARMAGLYSGATMLFENAGCYVLLALGAFMAGVMITVVCLRRNRRRGEDSPGDGEG